MPARVAQITKALLDCLSGLTGIEVGNGDTPQAIADDPTLTTPYVVVFALPTPGVAEGDLAEPTRHPKPEYQLTCVGYDQLQAQWVADEARARIVSNPPTATGYNLTWRFTDPGGTERDDDREPPLFYCVAEVAAVVGT